MVFLSYFTSYFFYLCFISSLSSLYVFRLLIILCFSLWFIFFPSFLYSQFVFMFFSPFIISEIFFNYLVIYEIYKILWRVNNSIPNKGRIEKLHSCTRAQPLDDWVGKRLFSFLLLTSFNSWYFEEEWNLCVRFPLSFCLCTILITHVLVRNASPLAVVVHLIQCVFKRMSIFCNNDEIILRK